MSNVNFSSLQQNTTASNADQFLMRLDNALSGADGFARITKPNLEKSFGVYSTVQSNSAAWTDAAAPTTLTYAASITPSLSDGISRKITMTGDLTLNSPANATDGSLWKCRFTASGADRTITLGANILTPRSTTFSGIVSSGFTRLFEMNYNGTKWWLVRNQEFSP